MKKLIAATTMSLALLAAAAAASEPTGTYTERDRSGAVVVYQFFPTPAEQSMCNGMVSPRRLEVLVQLVGGHFYPSGSGCWESRHNGFINIRSAEAPYGSIKDRSIQLRDIVTR